MDLAKFAAFLCIVLATQSKKERKGEAEWKGEMEGNRDRETYTVTDKETDRVTDKHE